MKPFNAIIQGLMSTCMILVLGSSLLIASTTQLNSVEEKPIDTTRIATYNLANYNTTNRWVDGVYKPDYPKPELEKDELRKVIIAVNPDILLVQEIGSADYLKELQADLAQNGSDYPHTAILEIKDQNRHLGVLSKLPLKEVHKHNLSFNYFGQPKPVKRGLLELHITLESGETLVLFGLHLKSKLKDPSLQAKDPHYSQYRKGEARAIRERILLSCQENQIKNYAILGDFNDSPNSQTIKTFQKKGQNQLSTLLPAIDSMGQYWTYFYAKNRLYETIDLILLSTELAQSSPKNIKAAIEDSSRSLSASDHRLVYADLLL